VRDRHETISKAVGSSSGRSASTGAPQLEQTLRRQTPSPPVDTHEVGVEVIVGGRTAAIAIAR